MRTSNMANFANTFKSEITRLARKEVRAHVDPLRALAANQRRQIAELKRQVVDLQKQVKAGSKKREAAPEATSAGNTRFSAKGLKTLRARLGLSAAEFGAMAGVSGQSIYGWETGKTTPREAQRAKLVSLRGLGKKEARSRLEALED